MSCREILTLQFGHYANFVGAHWWNSQELSFDYNSSKPSEINHDVLFREGLTPKGEITFTPRLILADLKSSLKSLPKHGNLYGEDNIEDIEPLWHKPAEVQAEPLINKNQFQQAIESTSKDPTNPSQTIDVNTVEDSEINVWSDFLYTRYHPRTVNIIKEYEHESIDNDFNSFPLGCKIWRSSDYEEEFSDKIRMYVEECDHFQGFHVLMDSTNAFSGLATSCIEYLHDEYETKKIFALPLIPSHYPDYKSTTDEEETRSKLKDSLRVLNLAFSYQKLSEEAHLFTPMCAGELGFRQPGTKINFNHLHYDYESQYHSSAILASALDTFSLKYRLKNTNYGLGDLTADLTAHGRKAVAGSLCLPFSLNQETDLIECLDNWDGPLARSITPRCKIGTDRMMQLVTLRGVPESRLKKPVHQAGKQKDLPAYKCNSIQEMLTMYYAYTCDASITNMTSVEKGFCVKTPFPQIFDKKIGVHGNVMFDPRLENVAVESVPVLAGLHNGAEIGDMLEKLHTETRKIRIGKFHQFAENDYGKDEFEECLDKIFSLRECYEDSYLI